MTATPESSAAASFAISSRAIVCADEVVSGTVVIEAGRIAGLERRSATRSAIEWGDDYLIPGLVELHTDHLEPHYSPRPKVFWDPVAAVLSYDAQIAASGITTVFDSLRAGSDSDRHALDGGLQALGAALDKTRKAGILRAQHLTHLRCEICSVDVIEETERFLSSFGVHLMSLMDHTPGVRQFRRRIEASRLLSRQVQTERRRNGCVHCATPAIACALPRSSSRATRRHRAR